MKNRPYEPLNIGRKRRIQADLIQVLKMIHGYSNVKVETSFEFENNGIMRGHTWKQKESFQQRCANISSPKELLTFGTVWVTRSTTKWNLDRLDDQERWVCYWTNVS